MTRSKVRRASSTYPPSFLKMLTHVANGGDKLTISNLKENKRSSYTSFRARVNAFRIAYYEEAVESGNQARIQIAQSLYAVTLRNPEKVDGQWQIVVEMKEKGLADAIDEAMEGVIKIDELKETKEEPRMEGAIAIDELLAKGTDVEGGEE